MAQELNLQKIIQNNNNYQIAPERSQKFISHNVFQIGQLLSSSMIRINVYNVKLLIVILCISLYRNFSTSPSPLPREAYRATSLCICCITASFKTKMFFLRTLFKCRSDYSLEHREIVREILGIENDNPQILMDYDLLSRSLVKLSHWSLSLRVSTQLIFTIKSNVFFLHKK